MRNPLRTVFFGTPRFAVLVLEELKAAGILPTLIVTAPDKPAGRGMELTPSEVKLWAEINSIDILQPENLKDLLFVGELGNSQWDLFIVAAYGKILPESVLSLPRLGTLNVHPSLLPKFRGPSPIQSQILSDEKEAGVSIMLLDSQMDHGPLVAQASITPEEWPLPYQMLEELLASEGGKLLAEILPEWINGKITPQEQDHEAATFCKKITKEDGLLDLSADPYKTYLRFLAFKNWPGTYFFVEHAGKDIRVKVTEAEFTDGAFIITKVIPEGKKEMSYEDFKKGLKK